MSAAKSDVSPTQMPIMEEVIRSRKWSLFKVHQPPLTRAASESIANTRLMRVRLKFTAPRARAGSVESRPPKDQQSAAASEKSSARYMERLGKSYINSKEQQTASLYSPHLFVNPR